MSGSDSVRNLPRQPSQPSDPAANVHHEHGNHVKSSLHRGKDESMKEDEQNRKKGSEEEGKQSLRRAGPIATAQTPTANTTMPPADNKAPTRRPAKQYDLAPWGRAKRSQKIRARSKRKGGWETAARETMKELNKVKLAKDKSWAEAASRKEEQNAKMKARMQKKAKAAAQKARGTAEYAALKEAAAATYRGMKAEELEELAEEEAMEMVDKTA